MAAMAEAIDDLDLSSPPGSPSSSLPQSIREVLESVRAECGVDDSGAFYSSDVSPKITWSNRPHKAPIFKSAFYINDNHQNAGQRKSDIDTNGSTSRSYRLTQSSALQKKITTDQEQPDQKTSRVESHPFYQSNVQKARNHEENNQVQNDVEKHHEPHDEDIVIIDLENPAQAHQSSILHTVEQPKVTIIPGHEPAKADQVRKTSHWLADDVSLRSSNVSNQLQMPIFGSKQAVDINVNHNTSGMYHGLTNRELNDTDPIILQAQSHPLSQSNVHKLANYQTEAIKNDPVLKGVQKNHDVATVDKEKKALTQLNSVGTQPEPPKLIGVPWYKPAKADGWIKLGDLAKVKTPSAPTSENLETTSNNYNSPVTRTVYGNSDAKMIPKNNIYMVNPMCDADNTVDIGLVEDRKRTARNFLQKEENQYQSKYGWRPKQLREREAAETVDLTDSPTKSVAGVNINTQQETTRVQDKSNVSSKSAGEEPKEKSAQLDSSQRNSSDGSVTSIETDELGAVCYAEDRNSNEIPNMKRGSNKFKPEYETSADLRDVDFPAVEIKKIKLKNFSNDEMQPNEATTETDEEKVKKHSKTNPFAIWKQELLSSDFNLMYGSLRAILMGTISKDDRNRLIQTMIATMSEIEQVTMHERNPTEHSVRCETPEFNDLEDEKNTSDSSEKEEISELSVKDEKAAKKRKKMSEGELGTWSLRKKELILNQKRLELLMKKNADSSWTCLVCDMEREVASNGVCRACLAFSYRIERAYTIGIPLPTCDHAKYSGGVKCKSCRFRKFSFMSMTATDTRMREISEKTCPVCEETSYSFRNAWQCSKCYYFFRKLVRRAKSMPYCKHSGEFPKTCDGCRCYKLQVGWHKFEKRPYPLPIVKKTYFKKR